MLPETRERLAHDQAHLVAALMTGSSAPAGFDAAELATSAKSLLSKRFRLVQLAWPVFETTLGVQFAPRFAEYARQSSLPPDAQSRQDGYLFARCLMSKNQLPDLGRLALLHTELDGVARPRRGFALRFAWLRERRRPAMGIKLPGCRPWIVPTT